MSAPGKAPDHPHDEPPPPPSPPKHSRRFSLGGLLRSRSLIGGTHRKDTPSISHDSLSSINETADHSSPSTGLHRRRTIADVMGKLFRRKSYMPLPSGDSSARSHRVSSYYMTAEGPASDKDLASTGGGDSPKPSQQDSTASLARRKSCVELKAPERLRSTLTNRRAVNTSCNEDILSYFRPPSLQRLVRGASKVLDSTRCALILLDRLYQGTLTLTTEDLGFQSTAFPSRLSFRLAYFDIVAIVPVKHFGSRGLQVATQSQTIKFVNVPNRNATLRTLTEAWLSTCKMHLLPQDEHGASLRRMRLQVETHSDGDGRQDDDNSSPAQVVCPCGGHYDLVLCERELVGIPLSLCSFIFGGGLVGDRQESFATHFFTERENITARNAEWCRNHQGVLVRTLKMQIPDPREPAATVPYRNEQMILKEAPDFMCVEAVMRPDQALRSHKLHVRWCITREGPTAHTSRVVVSAATESGSPNAPVDKHTEAWLMRVAVGDYSALLDAIDAKLNELQQQVGDKASVPEASLLARMWGYLWEILLFGVVIRWQEARISPRRLALAMLILFGGLALILFCSRIPNLPAISPEYAQKFALEQFHNYASNRTGVDLHRDIQEITRRLDRILAKPPENH